MRRANITAKRAIEPQITSAGPGLRRVRALSHRGRPRSRSLVLAAAAAAAAAAAGLSHDRGGCRHRRRAGARAAGVGDDRSAVGRHRSRRGSRHRSRRGSRWCGWRPGRGAAAARGGVERHRSRVRAAGVGGDRGAVAAARGGVDTTGRGGSRWWGRNRDRAGAGGEEEEADAEHRSRRRRWTALRSRRNPGRPGPRPGRTRRAGADRMLRLGVLGDVDRCGGSPWCGPAACRRPARDFWAPALRATPVRPPRPRIVAAAAMRVFKFFTSIHLLAGCDGSLRKRRSSAAPGTGKETAKPCAGRRGRPQERRYSGQMETQSAPGGRILVVEDEDSISQPFAEALRRAGFEAAGHPDRRRRAGAGGRGRAGPGDARPHPSRRRRPRRLPRAAAALRCADRDADRARHRDGQDRRPRAGRRRLRGQAVQRPRGDLADPRRAAAQRPARRDRRGREADPDRRSRARPRGPRRPARGRASSTSRARSSTCSPS